MRYIELLNSIALTVVRIYKHSIIKYYCDNCNSVVFFEENIRCNNCNDLHNKEFLVCPECGSINYSWICDNCNENGNNMVSIETRLEEIKEEIEEKISKGEYFNEINEDDENVKVALKIINYVNEYILKEKQNA